MGYNRWQAGNEAKGASVVRIPGVFLCLPTGKSSGEKQFDIALMM